MTAQTLFPGLRGKRALVTAGGQGLGHAIAVGLVEAGARVWICDVDPDRLARVMAEHPAIGTCIADVADPDGVDRLIDGALSALGGLDILVNNAGISGPTGPVESVEPAAWSRCLAVNLDGTFLCIRRAVPALKAAGGGSIVNISSTAGLMGYPLRAPYAAAKWGVIGLTQTLALELGAAGIRVNAVCPGSLEGPRMDQVIAAEAAARGQSVEAVRQSYVRQTSLRTFVSAEEVAQMVLFVCSDLGAKISGQSLCVDGHTQTLAG